MNDNTKRLAIAAFAAASLAPGVASAVPTTTVLQQAQQSVEATFGNTFAQTISAEQIGTTTGSLFTDLTVTTDGAGAMLTGAASLNPGLGTLELSGVTIEGITLITAAMATGIEGSVLSLDATVNTTNASSATVSTTVFGPSTIKATESIITSTINTLF